MQGGNQYAAGIAEVRDREHTVRLIIKEMFQDPKMFGRVSFPTQHGAGDTVRAYIKDTMLRYDHDEEEFGEEGEYLDETEDEADEEEGEELEESDSFRVEE